MPSRCCAEVAGSIHETAEETGKPQHADAQAGALLSDTLVVELTRY
jgi:hypothetical protein